jgi:hypothetical protein
MNSNTVLKKIMTLLSSSSTEVKLAKATLPDGTVVEAPAFEIGEIIQIVHENGEKEDLNGKNELSFEDEDNNEVKIVVVSEEGEIVEVMDVEVETIETEVEEEEVEMMDEDKEKEELNLEIISKTVTEMAYRIEELEKKVAEMQVEEVEEEVEDEEEDLPTFSGAPLMASKLNVSKNAGAKKQTRQSAFLSKLYNQN